MIPKDFRTYATKILPQEKILRDHALPGVGDIYPYVGNFRDFIPLPRGPASGRDEAGAPRSPAPKNQRQ
jgi:hypothetical protein